MIHWIITISRVFVAPICFLAIVKRSVLPAISLMAYAIISDFLDGYFARLLKSQSAAGAIADVIADKIFIYSVIAALACSNIKMLILFSVWLLRDIVLMCMWIFANNKFHSLPEGKIYTTLQFFIILAFVILHFLGIEIDMNILQAISIFFFVFAIITIRAYYKILI